MKSNFEKLALCHASWCMLFFFFLQHSEKRQVGLRIWGQHGLHSESTLARSTQWDPIIFLKGVGAVFACLLAILPTAVHQLYSLVWLFRVITTAPTRLTVIGLGYPDFWRQEISVKGQGEICQRKGEKRREGYQKMPKKKRVLSQSKSKIVLKVFPIEKVGMRLYAPW